MTGRPIVLCTFALCGLLGLAPLAAQERADRSQPPNLGTPPRLALPEIQKHALSNGLPVWLVELHEVPVVQVNLVVLAGSGDDPTGEFGLASLTAAMLDEGAGSRSALQIADNVDFFGATLVVGSNFDSSSVELNVPVSRLETALPIMADVALRPAFPADELERLREERLTGLLQVRDTPAAVSALAFARAVFGATHRYGTGAIGTATTMAAVTPSDLRAFHTEHYQPSNAALVVVGDVTFQTVAPLLESQFGAWHRGSPTTDRALPTAPQLTNRQIIVVDMPGAAQSQIRIGWVGVDRSTPDYFTLEVLNTILGGSFTSRLNQNLREEHGYSYSAGSRFEMRLSPGPFLAAAGVQTDKTAESVEEFFNELTEIGAPVGTEELEKAKNYLALGFPGEFETIRNLAGHLESSIVYNLPDGYFDRYVDNIKAVTAEDVQRAAATYIQPGRFAVVIVGDAAVIEPGIRALELGRVRVLSVDEAIGD